MLRVLSADGHPMAATVAPLDTATSVRCRLARIEGQAAGLGRMWDAQRPAEDLLDQIAAVRAALRGVAIAIVRDTTAERLKTAHPMTDDTHGLDDVLALVDRLLRCR
jgi:CsoR family transcriptional regulator, copper-sensing transcriptional repressor